MRLFASAWHLREGNLDSAGPFGRSEAPCGCGAGPGSTWSAALPPGLRVGRDPLAQVRLGSCGCPFTTTPRSSAASETRRSLYGCPHGCLVVDCPPRHASARLCSL